MSIESVSSVKKSPVTLGWNGVCAPPPHTKFIEHILKLIFSLFYLNFICAFPVVAPLFYNLNSVLQRECISLFPG